MDLTIDNVASCACIVVISCLAGKLWIKTFMHKRRRRKVWEEIPGAKIVNKKE